MDRFRMMEQILLDGDPTRKIVKNDLNVYLSGAFVIRSSFGTLVNLRAQLKKLFGNQLIHPTLSSSPIFVVHWNDLSEEKQQSIENARERRRGIRDGFGKG
jgi:hypothetical protein